MKKNYLQGGLYHLVLCHISFSERQAKSSIQYHLPNFAGKKLQIFSLIAILIIVTIKSDKG